MNVINEINSRADQYVTIYLPFNFNSNLYFAIII